MILKTNNSILNPVKKPINNIIWKITPPLHTLCQRFKTARPKIHTFTLLIARAKYFLSAVWRERIN